MPEELGTYLLLVLAAFAAGAMNSIAGGGTLLTFPALTGVVDWDVANGTSTVALMPGSLAGAWGYRKELAPIRGFAFLMLVPSLLGGLLGSLLVIEYPKAFGTLVPWLILTAAILFTIQPAVSRLTKRRAIGHHSETSRLSLAATLAFQFLVATYGGFFGAGIGILMLASLGFMGLTNIHQMNAVKTFLAFAINAMSVVVFVYGGLIRWDYAAAMIVAAVAGGYAGARLARRLPVKHVRTGVVVIAFALAAYYFRKQAG